MTAKETGEEFEARVTALVEKFLQSPTPNPVRKLYEAMMADNRKPLTPEELDAIEARAKAATEGPWVPGDMGMENAVYADSRQPGEMGIAYDIGENDVPFIAAARSDVPALVAEVRRLRAIIESVEWGGATYGDEQCCPECCSVSDDGSHNTGCALAEVLGRKTGDTKSEQRERLKVKRLASYKSPIT